MLITLEDAKQQLIKKAFQKEQGKQIEPCGHKKNFMDCFTGFKKPSGEFMLLFQYNIGKFTYAELGTFNLSEEMEII